MLSPMIPYRWQLQIQMCCFRGPCPPWCRTHWDRLLSLSRSASLFTCEDQCPSSNEWFYLFRWIRGKCCHWWFNITDSFRFWELGILWRRCWLILEPGLDKPVWAVFIISSSYLGNHMEFYVAVSYVSKSEKKGAVYLWPWTTKPVLSRWGIFLAIAKNTLYGSKLLIFLLCQKSLGH